MFGVTDCLKAAGAIALAAFFVPAAEARQPNHVSQLEGEWGWLPFDDDPPDMTGLCSNEPMRIWFSENGRRYHSQWETDIEYGYISTSPVYSATTTEDGVLVMFLQYDDETRLDPDGNPVAWYLVLSEPESFVWVREDWVEQGNTTRPMVRCEDRPIA